MASDATPRCASMASADRQMIGGATLGSSPLLRPERQAAADGAVITGQPCQRRAGRPAPGPGRPTPVFPATGRARLPARSPAQCPGRPPTAQRSPLPGLGANSARPHPAGPPPRATALRPGGHDGHPATGRPARPGRPLTPFPNRTRRLQRRQYFCAGPDPRQNRWCRAIGQRS
ncbi:hypothetical protein Veis_4140 [Verminephrobacter eiseniae EF01-2]|uniref:Uncharacterized protein n=1 Tax=Verminephrobacter eiseniae (strain EF01-2) TaxID=391735 RepID=A1WQD8_VEREI|nr:hypothetical protein Veis_4140 [Verminephrobacter eiseniae EF01-2]